jgi:hypothetical protein
MGTAAFGQTGTAPAFGWTSFSKESTVETTFDIMAVSKDVNARVRRRRTTRVVCGVGLALTAIWRRGVLAPILLLAGTALVVRGASDEPLRQTVRRIGRWLERPRRQRFGDGKRDLVDEASWQSFPASDPPSYAHGVSQTPQRPV